MNSDKVDETNAVDLEKKIQDYHTLSEEERAKVDEAATHFATADFSKEE